MMRYHRPEFIACNGETMLKRMSVVTATMLGCTSAAMAAATPNPLGLSDVVYTTSLSVLTMLFVVALLLESAFSSRELHSHGCRTCSSRFRRNWPTL